MVVLCKSRFRQISMTKEEYEKLVAEVNRLRNNLHLFNEETISESALDDLKHKITAFEVAHPDLISPDSPNYTIAGGVAEKFEKFTHKRRMLSLNDIFTLEELQAWENRWRDFYVKQYGVYPASWQTSLQYVIEPKVDGLAISLHYEGGILQRALTRGDGWVGELVTENVKQVADIPKQIPDLRKIEVRGEIFITKANFEELNKQILEGKQVGRFGKSGPEGVFANPRNAASGTIRQLDSSVVAQRNLSFIAYGVWIDEN